ncbi:hypothetical protein HYX12_04775 [Candidatus Woesearchaeota archaeon]|nr:hypothetical protein [Candidatus Woesearchaeota archaeon]
MKCFAITHPQLDTLCQQELKEFYGLKSASKKNVITVEVKDKENILLLFSHLQSVRRLLVLVDHQKELNKISLNFPWTDYFTTSFSFKVDVENIKGQENRFEIAKRISSCLFEELKKAGINAKIDFKNPDVLLIVYGLNNKKGEVKEYYVGIDLAGQEIHKRYYRLFPHSASFTGDIAYYLVKYAGFSGKERLLIGFCKDGTIAIEAALYANRIAVQKGTCAYQKFPLFQNINIPKQSLPEKSVKIFAFDESLPNITATRKNIQLAGVQEFLDFRKYPLEDLEIKYGKDSFEIIIFYLTAKDEERINEIYYQINYMLKTKGKILFITRKSWDIPISDKYRLVQKEELIRGDSAQVLWLLEKK